MAPITGEAAEEWAQYGNPEEIQNDRNIRNPSANGADPCAAAVRVRRRRKRMVTFQVARRKWLNYVRELMSRGRRPTTVTQQIQEEGSVQEVEPNANVEAEDDNTAPEVAIAPVVAEIPPIADAVQDDVSIIYEEGFIPWKEVDMPDVHRKSSALQLYTQVIKGSSESS